jgi:predicted dehydrogenase
MPGLPEVRIGIVGYGMMGKAHSYGYREAPRLRELPVRPRLRLISGRRRELVEKAAAAYGVEETTTDWRRLVESKDIDIVDICTPPGTHAEIAAAAAAAGKAVICEKPFATSYAEGKDALEAARRAGVLNAVGFNYRRLPAVSLMKRMIDEGAIGRLQLWRGCWLFDEFVDPADPVRLALRPADGRNDHCRSRQPSDRHGALDGGRHRRGQRPIGNLRRRAR